MEIGFKGVFAARFSDERIHLIALLVVKIPLLGVDRACLPQDVGGVAGEAVDAGGLGGKADARNAQLLFVGDVAVIPAPDLKQKQVIMECLVKTAKAVGVETPKVAILAATEQVLPSQPASLEAALLAKMADRGQIKGCIADGPLALDVAIDMESVQIKGLVSPVAGDADCILFPNIESGNVFYKANSKLVPGVRQAGILVGAKVPCVLSSRADSIDTKLNSIAIAAMSVK